MSGGGQFHEKLVTMNEALVLGSVRLHEFAESAVALNERLRVEIAERALAETALRQAQAQLTDRAGQLEELVVKRTAELTATNKELEAFVYSIAHDLRAPLRAMQGFSEMLSRNAGASLADTSKSFLHRINKSAQSLDAMLIDLVSYSRLCHEPIELAAVNLENAVHTTLSRLQKTIQATQARVEAAGPWPEVRAHGPTLGQVLLNLTDNALKFVRNGHAPVVRLRAEEKGESVRVWVEDNGPGIAADHQAQIFRLFTRLDADRSGGTGIGLAIVQKAVERMTGRVGVESILGQGSSFWFELPKFR
jgi:signal transduction histidine kinase